MQKKSKKIMESTILTPEAKRLRQKRYYARKCLLKGKVLKDVSFLNYEDIIIMQEKGLSAEAARNLARRAKIHGFEDFQRADQEADDEGEHEEALDGAGDAPEHPNPFRELPFHHEDTNQADSSGKRVA